MNRVCGACTSDSIRSACHGAFRKVGLVKVHWECWSKCNLKCGFCYRTKDHTLSLDLAHELVEIIASSGAQWITFAGGDPSIRPGIVALIRNARSLGLKIEVQTNANHIQSDFLDELLKVDQVGLSLDGPTADLHDAFRSSPGNFSKVLALLSNLSKNRVDTVVRTVVARSNFLEVHKIANLLLPFENIRKWSLLEFVPLGDGRMNLDAYGISSEIFKEVVERSSLASDRPIVDGFKNSAKAGAYALVSASGRLYGTRLEGENLQHQFVGNLLVDHLSDLAEALPFNAEVHQNRYGKTM